MPSRKTPVSERLRLALGCCLALTLPFPASAQAPNIRAPQDQAESGQSDEGQSLMEQGMSLLFQGIITEIAPDLGEMGNELREGTRPLWPAMADLARLMDDIGNYELPERLENGDILIRRRADAPPPPPLGEGLQNLLSPPDDTPLPPIEKVLPDGPKLDL